MSRVGTLMWIGGAVPRAVIICYYCRIHLAFFVAAAQRQKPMCSKRTPRRLCVLGQAAAALEMSDTGDTGRLDD